MKPLIAGSELIFYSVVASSVRSGDATTDPAPDRRGFPLSQAFSNLLLVASPLEQEASMSEFHFVRNDPPYPISYRVYIGDEAIGTVYKKWQDTSRTKVYEWRTEPPTMGWTSRKDAAEALRGLRG